MREFYFFILSLVMILGLSCISSAPAQPKLSRAEKAEMELVHKSFAALVRGMVEGDLKTVYQYLSTAQHRQQSYDEFVTDYKNNQDNWQTIFRGAYLKKVGVDENKATAIIIWGTGENALGDFSKEDNLWRLNFVRGTVSIIQPGPVKK